MYYINSSQQKVTIKDDTTIQEISITPETKIFVKNLGKQISWKNVFYIEYLGPIIIIPAFYIFGKRDKYTIVQHTAAAMGVLHFVKR